MGTDFRKEIGTTIDQRRDEYTKISDAIWGFAEPRFQEYESTKLQQEFLKARGFSVKADLAGEETAFTPGEQEWDYLYSRDAGNAFYLIGEKGKDGSIYCVGSGKAKPLREYIYQIRDAAAPDATPGIGKKAYGTQPVMHLCADISSLKNDTGFEPAYEFSSGIRETIRWMKERDK